MKNNVLQIACLIALFLGLAFNAQGKSDTMKVLIIDGQNNHEVWPKSTIMMKQYLEETDLFTVDINRTQFTWKANREKAYLSLAGVGETQDMENPKTDPDFSPAFAKYDVVVSNFGYKAADWPLVTQKALEDYMAKGGGFVVVHAADNCFPEWLEFNKMIGLGGWGGRTEKHGPYVYFTDEGKEVRDDSSGKGGNHGPQHEFAITLRDTTHPITQGMPPVWKHTKDECYAMLRGPAENMTILATGRDVSGKAPTQRHEPIFMVLDYGKGRVFHTTLGHDDYSCEGVGFIVSFQRGVEWAATGKVTQKIPADFPTPEKATYRKFELKKDISAGTWQDLLDPTLSQWEIWMGIPHESVQGLPEGTATSKNGTSGTPLGLNNDPKKVFSVVMEDNQPVLAITGEIYGGLTSLKSYENYHLQLQTKWGEKKWAPRLEDKRDSGLLYHCVGKHGSFWNVWKTCMESQIQEGDCGDLFCLAGTVADVKVTGNTWDPKGQVQSGNAKRSQNFENPNGPWNTIDIYVLGDRAVHLVNGNVVMYLENARLKDGDKPLTSGQIQIQSEGAEVYYRNIRICPITQFPDAITKAISGL